MKHRIDNYIKNLEKAIFKVDNEKLENLKKEHLVKISFYQHERLIHLIVTFMVVIVTFIAFFYTLINFSLSLLLLIIILLILLIFYIMHYYYLENAIHKMYDLYDKLNNK